MKKTAALLAAALTLSMVLCGCDEDTGPESAESPQISEQVVVSQEGDLGTGLIVAQMDSELDENPERKVRRAAIPVGFKPAVTMGGGVLGEEHYYYRNTLNQQGKKAYDQIRAGLLEGRSTIEMSVPISVEDAFQVYQMVVYDGPELFYVTTGSSCTYNNYGAVTSITPTYNELVYDIQGYTQQLQASVSQAVTAMRSLGEPLYQVKYAHDYLTHTVDYVSGSPHNQNCYSTLVLKQTVCAGYAHGLQYLLQQVNIPCAYVVGFAGEAHAWNILQLYGETYAMDVTWDDPLGNHPDTYYYGYFNITDDQLAQDHRRDPIAQPLPWGTGTACSYQNGFGGNAYGTDFSAIGGGGYVPVPQPEPVPDYDPTDVPDDYYPDDGDADQFYPDDYFPEELYPDGGENWWEDTDWENNDWDDALWSDDDSYWEDESSEWGWWNMLDESWSQDDWELIEDGLWEIWDEESWCYYIWNEYDESYYAVDGETDEMFWLNMETGEWESTGY